MTRAVSFSSSDVTRLLRALRKAGEPVRSVEIDPNGKIVAKLGAAESPAADGNPWDEVLTHDPGRTAFRQTSLSTRMPMAPGTCGSARRASKPTISRAGRGRRRFGSSSKPAGAAISPRSRRRRSASGRLRVQIE